MRVGLITPIIKFSNTSKVQTQEQDKVFIKPDVISNNYTCSQPYPWVSAQNIPFELKPLSITDYIWNNTKQKFQGGQNNV